MIFLIKFSVKWKLKLVNSLSAVRPLGELQEQNTSGYFRNRSSSGKEKPFQPLLSSHAIDVCTEKKAHVKLLMPAQQ